MCQYGAVVHWKRIDIFGEDAVYRYELGHRLPKGIIHYIDLANAPVEVEWVFTHVPRKIHYLLRVFKALEFAVSVERLESGSPLDWSECWGKRVVSDVDGGDVSVGLGAARQNGQEVEESSCTYNLIVAGVRKCWCIQVGLCEYKVDLGLDLSYVELFSFDQL